MPESNPLEILLAHDLWSTHQILTTCKTLTDEQFHQPFEMGPGSLHNTLVHMVTALRIWCDRLAHRDMRPRLEGSRYPIAEIATLLNETCAELSTLAHAAPLSDTISVTRDGKTRTFTRGAVVTHITTHGMHHRAQCLNMLRHLGIKPLPPSSVVEWTFHTGN